MSIADEPPSLGFVAGVDVGTVCTKAVLLNGDGEMRGQSLVPSRGYFQDCAHAALAGACEEAGVSADDLANVCGTGFAPDAVPHVTMTYMDSTCHVAGMRHSASPMPATIIDVGGHNTRVIVPRMTVSGSAASEVRQARRCALGVSAFLTLAANQLDVHPARLQELAAATDEPCNVSSYCSVFAGSEIVERLRDGHSREAIASGCVDSVVERVLEIGGVQAPAVIVGGVVEYMPGLAKRLAERLNVALTVPPAPMFTAALGAALLARTALKAQSTRQPEG